MEELRLEFLALLEQDVPARDLGYCFSLTLPGLGLEDCETYEEIEAILRTHGIADPGGIWS